EVEREHGVVVALEQADQRAFVEVVEPDRLPLPHRAGAAAGGKQAPVAGERERIDFAGIAVADLASDGAYDAPGAHVPDADGLVVADRDQLASVGSEDDAADQGHMALGIELQIRPFARACRSGREDQEEERNPAGHAPPLESALAFQGLKRHWLCEPPLEEIAVAR